VQFESGAWIILAHCGVPESCMSKKNITTRIQEQTGRSRTSDQLVHLPAGSKCVPVRHLDIRPLSPIISSQDPDFLISISTTTSPVQRINMQIL